MSSTLVRHATILTMNDRLDIVRGDVPVREGRIAAIGPDLAGPAAGADAGDDGGVGAGQFAEMRLAVTLQAVHECPGAMTARDAVWMATRAGAKTLGSPSAVAVPWVST
jgi:cytosine/adenosine deaminase-related metal-dependent hydrolase